MARVSRRHRGPALDVIGEGLSSTVALLCSNVPRGAVCAAYEAAPKKILRRDCI